MCIGGTYNNVHIGKKSYAYPIQSGLKQGDALSAFLSDIALEYAIRKGSD
jgi:hypothetical protein